MLTYDYALTVIITMITVVDPFGLAPIFITLAGRFERKKQIRIILKSFTVAMFVSLLFLFFGKYIFHYLEISYNAVFIVGGILLFLIGLDMIYAQPRKSRSSPDEQEEALHHEDLSVFPLAIPMISGPGTIATIVMFASRHETPANYLLVFASVLVSYGLAALVMLFSLRLIAILGRTGLNVLGRLMGMILAALAVQFIINAVTDILKIAP
ncbi:MAG: MarC family protein [Candidatus Wallbacteria bacterium]|nr:MarC family protein [Candidatus Wallbacteria bacterium]